MARKKQDYFKPFKDVAVGTTSLGITTAVGAGIAAQAPAGSPSLMGGFTTMAGFVPLATTAVMGKHVLGLTKNLQPRRKRKRR